MGAEMNKVTIVDGDDWQGLYLNGYLHHQGHSIPLHVVGDLVNYTAAGEGIHEWVNIEVDYEWMAEVGHLPNDIKDIPHEVIVG